MSGQSHAAVDYAIEVMAMRARVLRAAGLPLDHVFRAGPPPTRSEAPEDALARLPSIPAVPQHVRDRYKRGAW